MSDSTVIATVRELVTPIVTDLGLELYDVERASGTLRILVDTATGTDERVTIDTIALVARLVSRELDHADPLPGRYTLEVSSPGVERPLRTPEQFRGAIGETVAVRLRDVPNEERRVEGELVAADDTTITVQTETTEEPETTDSSGPSDGRHVVALDQIDRARTTFQWGSATASRSSGTKRNKRREGTHTKSNQRKEERSS